MSEIVLHRPSKQKLDRRRAYWVVIDGQKVGKIKEGESLSLPIPPGEHRLQLKIDWCTSEKRRVVVGDDDQVTFVCKPRASRSHFLTLGVEILYLITFGRKGYIDLFRAQDELDAA